ncbi:MAG: hypothetical protein R3D44_10570 [Hyphomicrobiaceae bacterium]
MSTRAAADREAIGDYERYMDARAAILSGNGRHIELPHFPNLAHLEAAVPKGYRLTRGKPARLLLDDW